MSNASQRQEPTEGCTAEPFENTRLTAFNHLIIKPYRALRRKLGLETPTADITIDALGDIINNDRRRFVVDALAEEFSGDERITTADLADHVTARETGDDIDAIDTTERKRVYVSLYQTHLPKLDKLGVLEWDKHNDGAAIKPVEETQRVARVLDATVDMAGGSA